MPDKANFNAIIERRVEVYENHAQDCRVKPCGEIAPTLNGKMGTGGNNVPLKAECFGNVSHARGVEMHGVSFDGGFGFPVEKDSISGTLHNNTCPGHCNGVILTNSNGEDVMPTIRASEYKQVDSQKDTGGGYVIERRVPLATHNFECYDNAQGVSVTLGARRSGDTLEIEAPLGFKCKPSGKARSLGEGKEVSPCLSASSCDASVAFGINANGVTKTAQMPCREECAETLAVRHQGGVLVPNVAAMRYVVRRLTPTECERLMGLPDGWTLPAFEPDEITDALVAEFVEIFDTFGAVMAGYSAKKPPKPKTAAWVRTWLERIANPATCPDAPRYKACGNGWATNQPRWILMNLLERDSPGWQFECRFAGAAPACRPASGADVYNGQVHDEVADTIGANSGTANTAGGKVIV